jgi:hypothetical protein
MAMSGSGSRTRPAREASRHPRRRTATTGILAAGALVIAGAAALVLVAGTPAPSVTLPRFVAAGRIGPGTPTTRPTTSTTTTIVPVAQATTKGTITYITPVRRVHVEDDRVETGDGPSDDSGSHTGAGDS